MEETDEGRERQLVTRRLVRAYRDSGLSQKRFCSQVLANAISQPTLSRALNCDEYSLGLKKAEAVRQALDATGDGRAELSRGAEGEQGQGSEADNARGPLDDGPSGLVGSVGGAGDPLGRRAELIDAGIARLMGGATVEDLGLFVSLANELDVDNRAAAAALAHRIRYGGQEPAFRSSGESDATENAG